MKTKVNERRPIPSFDGYAIGDDGSVWTCHQRRSLGMGHGTAQDLIGTWRPMKTHLDSQGYVRVGLMKAGKSHHLKTANLVLFAFFGPRPKGQLSRHLDGK